MTGCSGYNRLETPQNEICGLRRIMAMRPRAILSIAITGSMATAMLCAQGKPVVPLPPPTGAILSGRFTLEDGSPPPDRVRIELTCNSLPRPQGWSDGKGGFSVQLGV